MKPRLKQPKSVALKPYSYLWLRMKAIRRKRRRATVKGISLVGQCLTQANNNGYSAWIPSDSFAYMEPFSFKDDNDDDDTKLDEVSSSDSVDWLDVSISRRNSLESKDCQVTIVEPPQIPSFANVATDDLMYDQKLDGMDSDLNDGDLSEVSTVDGKNLTLTSEVEADTEKEPIVQYDDGQEFELSTIDPMLRFIYVDTHRVIVMVNLSFQGAPSIGLVNGTVRVKSLIGKIVLNGYQLNETETVICSTGFGEYIIKLEAVENEDKRDRLPIKSKLRSSNVPENVVTEIMDIVQSEGNEFIILQLEPFSCLPLIHLESLINVQPMKSSFFKLDCINQFVSTFEPNQDQLLTVVNRLTSKSIVLVCGPKNIGKSSTIRWLINKVIEDYQVVYYADADPGQPEFTQPGCLSLTMVTKPILSPPFVSTLLNQENILLSSSVGNTNMASDPDLYLVNFRNLWTHALTVVDDQPKPIFINTMGWMKDIGLQLLLDIIRITTPTDIIELSVKDDHKPIFAGLESGHDSNLHPSRVCSLSGWSVSMPTMEPVTTWNKYNYLNLPTHSTMPRMSPKRSRISMQLANLSLIEEAIYKRFDEITPIKLNYSELFLHIVKEFPVESNKILDIINSSWVHLCRLDNTIFDETPDDVHVLPSIESNQCLGVGIVKSVDRQSKTLNLITSLTPKELTSVNCIIKPHGLFIPDEIVLKQVAYNNLNPPFVALVKQ